MSLMGYRGHVIPVQTIVEMYMKTYSNVHTPFVCWSVLVQWIVFGSCMWLGCIYFVCRSLNVSTIFSEPYWTASRDCSVTSTQTPTRGEHNVSIAPSSLVKVKQNSCNIWAYNSLSSGMRLRPSSDSWRGRYNSTSNSWAQAWSFLPTLVKCSTTCICVKMCTQA